MTGVFLCERGAVMHDEIIRKAEQIIMEKAGRGNEAYCTLALLDQDGYPTTSTISIARADGLKWLSFCTRVGSKAERIMRCNKASVCINSPEYHISLTGRVEMLTDMATKKDMWVSGLLRSFDGVFDPDYCVLKFTTERYKISIDWQETKGTMQRV